MRMGGVLLCAVASCGRVGFDLSEFGRPLPMSELNTPFNENETAFSADELEIVIVSMNDLYHATRANRDAPFGPAVPITELNSTGNDTAPELSPDGLTLYYVRDSNVVVTTRAARGASWAAPVVVPELSQAGNLQPSRLVASGLAMYATRGTANVDLDLYVARRSATDQPWGAPQVIAELQSPVNETDQWVDDTELVTYFSRRVGGFYDLFVSTRDRTGDPWREPQRVEALSTPGNEADAWLPPSGDRIYFTRDVDGQRDMFFAERY